MNDRTKKELEAFIHECAIAYRKEFPDDIFVDGEWTGTAYEDAPQDVITYSEFEERLQTAFDETALEDLDATN
jgi:hypothetical protein